MDKLGVAFSFISITSPNLSRADDEVEKEYVRRVNEEGAAFVAKYPNRLGLMAELPLPNIESSLEEAKYALDVLGADGFGLKTHYRGKYLGCMELDPLMEFLNKRKTVVVVHPAKPYNHFEGVNEDLPIPAFEFFVETTRTFINMVLKDTFNHYPDIKWVFPHVGAFISLISDRFDSFSVIMKLKSPYLNADFFGAMKHVYFDLAGFSLPKQIQILKQNVPAQNMLYGSDGPYTPELVTVAQAGALEQTKQFNMNEKEMIFTQNAIALFPRLGEILGVNKNVTQEDKKRMRPSRIWVRKLISAAYLKIQNKRSQR
jgi:predicted TIM-barrel fold metal-dependent hydrolase